MNIIKLIWRRIRSTFKKPSYEIITRGENILRQVSSNRGLLWEDIKVFINRLKAHEKGVVRGTSECDKLFPLKHHFADGLYTREIFMPKGSIIASLIHRTNHPSFLLKGDVSILCDDGTVKRIKAPLKIMTEAGTQRVLYMHEDTTWVCVYRTDKTTVDEAEKEVYTDNYLELPKDIINNKKLTNYKEVFLCQVG